MGHCPQSVERWSSTLELVSWAGWEGFGAEALGYMGSSFKQGQTIRESVSCLTSRGLLPLLLFIFSPLLVTYVELYIYHDENETINSCQDISFKGLCCCITIISLQRAEGIEISKDVVGPAMPWCNSDVTKYVKNIISPLKTNQMYYFDKLMTPHWSRKWYELWNQPGSSEPPFPHSHSVSPTCPPSTQRINYAEMNLTHKFLLWPPSAHFRASGGTEAWLMTWPLHGPRMTSSWGSRHLARRNSQRDAKVLPSVAHNGLRVVVLHSMLHSLSWSTRRNCRSEKAADKQGKHLLNEPFIRISELCTKTF